MVKSKIFSFVGYKNYPAISKKLQMYLGNFFITDQEKLMRFQIAVDEAVLNATKYGLAGWENTKVSIKISMTGDFIYFTVSSRTTGFDAFTFQRKLKDMLRDESYRTMAWNDYTGDTEKGRGVWFILSAVDLLFMDAKGQAVTLSMNTQSNSDDSLLIYSLVPRFCVVKNGVIYT